MIQMISILLIIVLLTTVNALFAASEMALVSIKPSTLYQLKQNGGRNAVLLEKVTKDSTKYLSTIQVAITFSGFLSSAFAGSSLSVYLVDFLDTIGISIQNNIAVIIITVLLSFFTLVFGELVPKRVALSKSIKIAQFSAPIIYVAMKIFAPFVWLLTITTRGVVRLVGIKAKDKQETVTEKDIKELIVYGHIKGLYKTQEKDMLERIFMFDDLQVEKIMTPLKDVISLDTNTITKESIKEVIESQFSRVPVFNQTTHEAEGVILVKDVLTEIYNKKDIHINIKNIIRKPYIISNTQKINNVLLEMKKLKLHLAFIENDQHQIIGIVTLEDIIEEIVGEIYDEHDK